MNNIFSKLIRGRGAILNYHRVLPLDKNYNSLVDISVSTDNFINQINYLKKNFNIVSLNDLILHLKSESNDFKIAITFDDGYRDNLNYAYPILKKFNVPATIYVITKFINNKFIPWWIKLDNYIQNNSHKSIKDQRKEFSFYKEKFLFTNQLTIDFQLSLILKKENKLKYDKIFLNHKEVKYLSDQKLITIGSHSHSHYNFSQIQEKQAYNEFKISKSILEKITKKKILHFAYPYGGYKNLNFNHSKILIKLGYLSAVTTIREKLNYPDFFFLPRIFVNNHSNLLKIKLKLLGLKNFY